MPTPLEVIGKEKIEIEAVIMGVPVTFITTIEPEMYGISKKDLKGIIVTVFKEAAHSFARQIFIRGAIDFAEKNKS